MPRKLPMLCLAIVQTCANCSIKGQLILDRILFSGSEATPDWSQLI